MTKEALKALAEAGYTFREQFIDGDPTLGLNGIRLTNAALIWEDAFSIQIFDRETCSIGRGGLTNDDHVSLTKTDGREFLEWLKMAHPEVLSEEVWEKLPAGPAFRDSKAGINVAKAELIQVCARELPELFGPGSKAAAGANFYRVLADHITRPVDEHARVAMMSILNFESLAHECYKTANALLRAAAGSEGEIKLDHAKASYAYVCMAEHLKNEAETMRLQSQRIYKGIEDNLPPAHFPEAFGVEQPWVIVEQVMRAYAPPAPDSEAITENAAHISSPRVYDALEIADEGGPGSGAALAPHAEGTVITITDPDNPHYRQMGSVYRHMGQGRYAIEFRGASNADAKPIFTHAQIKPIA